MEDPENLLDPVRENVPCEKYAGAYEYVQSDDSVALSTSAMRLMSEEEGGRVVIVAGLLD
jgi:hypothetical protein